MSYSMIVEEATPARARMYWMTLGVTLAIGFAINYWMVTNIPAEAVLAIKPWVLLIGYFACAIIGMVLSAKSDTLLDI